MHSVRVLVLLMMCGWLCSWCWAVVVKSPCFMTMFPKRVLVLFVSHVLPFFPCALIPALDYFLLSRSMGMQGNTDL